MLSNITFLMIFAVHDLLPLTLLINCCFYIFLFAVFINFNIFIQHFQEI